MKPTLPQGTRDFTPAIVQRRQYIRHTIEQVFMLYGFQPIETPALEQLGTLLGKYGDEGDRLIFKIINNGLDNPKNSEKARAAFEQVLNGKSDPRLTERALRYDLTIPFARFIVMHQHELAFPFRRYQMQPVWRADRPQKGRYREFWQCDADIVGSDSLVNEAELIAIYREVFRRLAIPDVTLRINNRKILTGLAICCGAADKLTDITVAIDKLDKIQLPGVLQELHHRGLSETQTVFIEKYLSIGGDNSQKIASLQQLLQDSEEAQLGIEELQTTMKWHRAVAQENWTNTTLQVDFTLARGLNYYTGFIIEAGTEAVAIGSIGGGGRYDDLTGLFGLKGMSGVGISFGVDRLYDVMDTLDAFPEKVENNTRILFLNMQPDAMELIAGYVRTFREAGIASEMYLEKGKMDKQMKYAHKRRIPYVAIVGSTELENGQISIKDMRSGQQEALSPTEVITRLKNDSSEKGI